MKVDGVDVIDTFTEMFPIWVCRFLVTAENEKWASTAGMVTKGYATSIIAAPVEAGIEGFASPDQTPDGRPGVIIQMYHTDRVLLKGQMIARIAQCILTCPTTAAFDVLEDAKRKAKVGRGVAKFGDGFQVEDKIGERKVWRIPVMEGEFIVEDSFGMKRGVGGGMFLILSQDQKSGLEAGERAVEAIRRVKGVILPFPGGLCRSGSKVGSMKYKLKASTNQIFCPTLRGKVAESLIPDGVANVYEIVVNGLNVDVIKEALREGIMATVKVPGVISITSANYGGKLGKYQLPLKDALGLPVSPGK